MLLLLMKMIVVIIIITLFISISIIVESLFHQWCCYFSLQRGRMGHLAWDLGDPIWLLFDSYHRPLWSVAQGPFPLSSYSLRFWMRLC